MSLRCDLPLFVPALRADKVPKALAAAHDAIILDLEDAVAPAHKAEAQRVLLSLGPLLSDTDVTLLVRINGSGTPWHDEDLRICAALPLQGVVLPKAESSRELSLVRNTQPRGCQVLALVETAAGIAALRDLAPAADRLIFGSVDYAADIGAAHSRDALALARQLLVLESRLAKLPPPIDGVTTALRDALAVTDDAAWAQALGFGGKLLIHPAQIAPARAGFAPSVAEVDHARRLLAHESAGASAFEGAMTDAPVLARARQILARATRYGL